MFSLPRLLNVYSMKSSSRWRFMFL
jgi:hypothetical protein